MFLLTSSWRLCICMSRAGRFGGLVWVSAALQHWGELWCWGEGCHGTDGIQYLWAGNWKVRLCWWCQWGWCISHGVFTTYTWTGQQQVCSLTFWILFGNLDIEHNKDRPAGDLYPNLQVIKFLEANHDPQVLDPFWSQPAGQTCRFAGDPQVSAGWGTHRYRSSWPTGICIQDSTFYNFINQLCGNLSLQNICLIYCYYIFHGPSKVFLMYIIYQVIIWN